MKKLLFFFSILLLAIPCYAKTIYVKENTGGSTGTNWADAYSTLQEALDNANSDSNVSQIWVAAGTYKPTYDYGLGIGDRGKHFRMINGVAIYGGFVGNEPNTFDVNDRNLVANKTILSGDIGISSNNSDNCYHIFYHLSDANLDSSSVLDGFTITGGNAENGNPNYHGGGMCNESSSPTLINCTFSGNRADYGSGMYNHFSNPTLTNCTFSGNSNRSYGVGGGGICNNNSNPILTNCTFNGNLGGYAGGGISNNNSSPILTNCTFSGNSADGAYHYGGGIYNNLSSPTLTNCTFSGNSASRGGGMYNSYISSPMLTNCTFSGNLGGHGGGGMHNFWRSHPILANCTFTDNSAEDGGGMYNNDNCSPTVTNCSFTDNSAQNSNGGGMYNDDNSSPILTSCKFSGNYAVYYGGGMYNKDNSSPIFTNCIFSGNSGGYGGGMRNYTSSPTLTNCTFSGNSANVGGGVSNVASNTTLVNSIIWGNMASNMPQIYNYSSTPDVTYSCIEGGYSGGSNIINADPCFVDFGYWDANGTPIDANDDFWVDGNYRLMAGSPCIDVGDNNSVPVDTNDLDNDGNTVEPIPFDLNGFARFIDDLCTADTGNSTPPIVDMGAYEFLRSDIDSSGDVNFKDFSQFALHWLDITCGLCGDADLTCDGDVNGDDLRELADNWLEGSL